LSQVPHGLILRRSFGDGPEVPTRNFANGDTIFREGDCGNEFFVVVRGEVEIRSGNRLLETLGQNSIFGEMTLIDDNPRTATVVALTDVTAATIKEKQFLFLVQHTPFFALRVMRVLALRLRLRIKRSDRRGLSADDPSRMGRGGRPRPANETGPRTGALGFAVSRRAGALRTRLPL
jgi:CRP/FNR family transcriptional regulator, cyclic AMP receptor protein